MRLSMPVGQRDPPRLAFQLTSGQDARLLNLAARLFPDLPRSSAALIKIVKLLFVFECVHRSVIAIVLISNQLLVFHKALKYLQNELFSWLHILEYRIFKYKETAVDADRPGDL